MRYTSLTQKLDTIWSDGLCGDAKSEYFELTWGNNRAYGGSGNDVFWDVDGSTVAGNHIWLSSDDRTEGGYGDDLVFAGLGADTIDGGAGTDTLDNRYSSASVILDINAGRGNGTSASATTGDRFTGIERFNGSNHDDTFVLSLGEPAEDVTIDGGAGAIASLAELRGSSFSAGRATTSSATRPMARMPLAGRAMICS